jgi:hypothetical protein
MIPLLLYSNVKSHIPAWSKYWKIAWRFLKKTLNTEE